MRFITEIERAIGARYDFPGNRSLEPVWHLLIGIVGAVSFVLIAINARIKNDHSLLPPDSRQSQYLRYVLELSALLLALALPRGIEPLFQP
jgi:hypothetical protein